MVYKVFADGSGNDMSFHLNHSGELTFFVSDTLIEPTIVMVIPNEEIDEFFEEIKKYYTQIKNG